MITNILAISGILVFASILIVVACINVASSKGREREAEDLEQLENIRKQKKEIISWVELLCSALQVSTRSKTHEFNTKIIRNSQPA